MKGKRFFLMKEKCVKEVKLFNNKSENPLLTPEVGERRRTKMKIIGKTPGFCWAVFSGFSFFWQADHKRLFVSYRFFSLLSFSKDVVRPPGGLFVRGKGWVGWGVAPQGCIRVLRGLGLERLRGLEG